jgi:hypothetical protein
LKGFFSRTTYRKLEEKALPIIAIGFSLNMLSILLLPLFSESVEKIKPFVQGLLYAMMFYGFFAIVFFVHDVFGSRGER